MKRLLVSASAALAFVLVAAAAQAAVRGNPVDAAGVSTSQDPGDLSGAKKKKTLRRATTVKSSKSNSSDRMWGGGGGASRPVHERHQSYRR